MPTQAIATDLTQGGPQPAAPGEGGMSFEVLFYRRLQQVSTRIHQTENLDRLMLEFVNQVSPGQDPNNPLFADAARAWVRDFLGAVLGGETAGGMLGSVLGGGVLGGAGGGIVGFLQGAACAPAPCSDGVLAIICSSRASASTPAVRSRSRWAAVISSPRVTSTAES